MLAFLYILKINSKLLEETVLQNNDLYIYNKVDLLANVLNGKNIQNINELTAELRKYSERDSGILYILIFSKTNDDNYFKLKNKIRLNQSVTIKTRIGKIIREKKMNNYLKNGLFKPVMDPQIYTINGIFYKTLYYPFSINKSRIICKFLISSSEVITTLNEYSEKIDRIKKYLILIATGTVVIVIITILLFVYNFRVLIKNISYSFKKASDGSLENVLASSDDDLNELANSFNDIISELKEKKESFGDLFKLGVDLLKDNKYDDSIAVFRTITIIKPDNFGSYFNLGVTYAKQKNFQSSLEMFYIAHNINPAHTLTQTYIEKVKHMYNSNERNPS